MKSIHFQDPFTAVRWVADQSLALQVDDEVEKLQGDLANEDWAIVGQLGDIRWAISSLNSQANGAIDIYYDGSRARNRRAGADESKTQLLNHPSRHCEHCRARVNKGVMDFNRSHLIDGEGRSLYID